LKLNAPINFDVVAVNLDQKQPGFPEHILPEYLESIGVEYKIVEENTYGIVKEKIPEACPKRRAAPKIKSRELTTKAKDNWRLESQVIKRTAFRTSFLSL